MDSVCGAKEKKLGSANAFYVCSAHFHPGKIGSQKYAVFSLRPFLKDT